MDQIFRIAVVGIGGVGGYVGGKLAEHASENIEIIFIARGSNEAAIKSKGLTLITGDSERIVYPSLVTSQAEEAGAADLIICCVKSYDLEGSLVSITPMIKDSTIILPLLNGVDASGRIRNKFPDADVWEGCVYIVSRLIAPGVIKQTGAISQVYFGSIESKEDSLERVENIFKSAGINATASSNILQMVWEKYLFISPIATLTSYLDLNMGAILGNPEHKKLLLNLLQEATEVAIASHQILPQNIVETISNRFLKLPPETTSSMHNDFQRGNKTELDSLTAYVVNLGNQFNVATPTYDKLLQELEKRTKVN